MIGDSAKTHLDSPGSLPMKENKNGGDMSAAKYEMVSDSLSQESKNLSGTKTKRPESGKKLARTKSSISYHRENSSANLEPRKVSLKDVKQILPTCLILLITLLITLTVIPYAFSNVIKQMQAVEKLEDYWATQEEEAKMNATLSEDPVSAQPDDQI